MLDIISSTLIQLLMVCSKSNIEKKIHNYLNPTNSKNNIKHQKLNNFKHQALSLIHLWLHQNTSKCSTSSTKCSLNFNQTCQLISNKTWMIPFSYKTWCLLSLLNQRKAKPMNMIKHLSLLRIIGTTILICR